MCGTNNFFDFHCFYKVLAQFHSFGEPPKGDAWEDQNVNISFDLLQNRRFDKVDPEGAGRHLQTLLV